MGSNSSFQTRGRRVDYSQQAERGKRGYECDELSLGQMNQQPMWVKFRRYAEPLIVGLFIGPTVVLTTIALAVLRDATPSDGDASSR